jgi:hypothetical protein
MQTEGEPAAESLQQDVSDAIAEIRLREAVGWAAGVGAGHIDRFEALLGDAKRAIEPFSSSRRQNGSEPPPRTSSSRPAQMSLSTTFWGRFALDMPWQFDSTIITLRSRAQNDELRIAEF